jgi:hypothetical protein
MDAKAKDRKHAPLMEYRGLATLCAPEFDENQKYTFEKTKRPAEGSAERNISL